jgi:hypothetical protein
MLAFLSSFLLSAALLFVSNRSKEIRLIILIPWLLALPWPAQPSGAPMDFGWCTVAHPWAAPVDLLTAFKAGL